MSKILFIGDPHIRHTHLKQGVELLRWIEQIVEQVKPDVVVNLGDTFDTHSVIRSEVVCEVSKHIDTICNSLKTTMVMVLGNHDMWRPNDSTYHALQVFNGKYKNLHIIDRPTVLDNIEYIPYLPDNNWPDRNCSIVVTHNTFIGADYGYRTAEDGISVAKVSADIVVSGHIHKRQELDEGRIIYPGTPMAISASDADQVKGILLFETDTFNRTFISSPFPIWRTRDVVVASGGVSDLFGSRDHWIVTLKGSKSEIRYFLESKEVKDLRNSISIRFKTEFTDNLKLNRVSIKSTNLDIMVDQYIDKVYQGSLDKDTIKSLIKDTLGEVK